MPESMMQPDLQDVAPVQGVRALALARASGGAAARVSALAHEASLALTQ